MPRGTFKIHNEAAIEIRSAKDWYLARSADAAQGFVDQLDHALARILTDPLMSASYVHGTRAVKLHRYPYVIVYKFLASHLHVMAVAHTSRRKGYWKSRVRDIEED